MENMGKAATILATFVDTIARIIRLVAQSPVGQFAGKVLGAVPGAVQGLEKEGIGTPHFGPMTQDDKDRNLRLGYDRYGAKINPDGSSANFPNPGDALKATTDPKVQSTPWYKQKNFGFGWGKSNNDPSTPGNAAATPGPSMAAFSVGGQNAVLGERMMQWFGQESMATQQAADAAERRDTKLERLLVSMENWFRSNSGKAAGGGAGGTGVYGSSFGGAIGPGGQLLGGGSGAGGGGGPAGAGGSGPHSASGSAGGPGGGGSGSFIDAVANIESNNRNIKQGVVDVNTRKGTPAGGYFQIIDPTWRRYAAAAGVDVNKYPTAMSAPRDVQAQVAAQIPANQFGPRTQRMLHEQFGAFDTRKTIGQLNEQFGGSGGGGQAGASANSTSEIRGPGGGNAADANALLAQVKATHPHLSNEQCVTLVREYTGMGGTVKDWRKGQNVLGGNMKVGTPIATFMSASGKQSDRYDAGGIGTPGAGTSHAALFGGYTRDKDGQITGINVIEQYAYSGRPGQQKGPHIQHYGVGGYGEHGAENYFGIQGPGGGKGQRTASLNGMDNDNWQQKPIHNVQIHNRTGSDVNIAASTVMASS
jgi:hypothetical protein